MTNELCVRETYLHWHKNSDAVKKNIESFLALISFLPVNFCVFDLNIKYLAYVKKRVCLSKYITSKLLSHLEYISFILIIPSL